MRMRIQNLRKWRRPHLPAEKMAITVLFLCLLFGCNAVFASAPGDEHSLCSALGSPSTEGGRVVLLNSYNYINLIAGFFPPPVWTQANLDGNGNGVSGVCY